MLEIIDREKPKIIGICTARGGSTRLPDKNMRLFAGRPLLAWTCIQAVNSLALDEFWVTSDSQHTLDCAVAHGARPYLRKRDPDDAPGYVPYLQILKDIAKPDDIFVGIFTTSPHRKVDDIDNAIKKYFDSPNHESKFLISVEKIHEDMRMEMVNDDYVKAMPAFENQTCKYSGLIHVSTRSYYEKVIAGEIEPYYIPYFIDAWQSLDINTQEQLRLCELVFYDRILEHGLNPYAAYKKGGLKI